MKEQSNPDGLITIEVFLHFVHTFSVRRCDISLWPHDSTFVVSQPILFSTNLGNILGYEFGFFQDFSKLLEKLQFLQFSTYHGEKNIHISLRSEYLKSSAKISKCLEF